MSKCFNNSVAHLVLVTCVRIKSNSAKSAPMFV